MSGVCFSVYIECDVWLSGFPWDADGVAVNERVGIGIGRYRWMMPRRLWVRIEPAGIGIRPIESDQIQSLLIPFTQCRNLQQPGMRVARGDLRPRYQV